MENGYNTAEVSTFKSLTQHISIMSNVQVVRHTCLYHGCVFPRSNAGQSSSAKIRVIQIKSKLLLLKYYLTNDYFHY